MSFNKNEKSYNKEIMRSGRQSMKYIDESLANLNRYSNDYAGRLDFWTNKINNRQLDLLSGNYLASNARMLRGQGQFGSNSALSRQIEENAYDQQNYLANVQNANLQAANALQNNELQALYNNVNINYSNRDAGLQAAQNLDRINNSWLNILSPIASTAGAVLTATGVGAPIGYGLMAAGNIGSSIAAGASSPVGYQYQRQANQSGSFLGRGLGSFTNLSSGQATGQGQSIFSTTNNNKQGYKGTLPQLGTPGSIF